MWSSSSDDEWYVKRIKMYGCSEKTIVKRYRQLGIPIDPRLSCNYKEPTFRGYTTKRVRLKLDVRSGFDTRKLKHIDKLEHNKVGDWGRTWHDYDYDYEYNPDV